MLAPAQFAPTGAKMKIQWKNAAHRKQNRTTGLSANFDLAKKFISFVRAPTGTAAKDGIAPAGGVKHTQYTPANVDILP
jgi:hypothetical protein